MSEKLPKAHLNGVSLIPTNYQLPSIHMLIPGLALLLLMACHPPNEPEMPDMNTNPAPKIIYTDKNGRTITNADLKDLPTGPYKFQLITNGTIPEGAMTLQQEGRTLGSQGKYAEAIAKLREAAALAPTWPYPLYDIAFSHLLQENYTAALDYYKQSLALSPRGFFTAITAVDILERENAGEFPQGTYRAYSTLEFVSDPEQKAAMLNALIDTYPTFSPAYKDKMMLTADLDEKIAVIHSGLESKPDIETKGILLINKALALHAKGDTQQAIHILGAIALDASSPLFPEHMAKQCLNSIVNDK